MLALCGVLEGAFGRHEGTRAWRGVFDSVDAS